MRTEHKRLMLDLSALILTVSIHTFFRKAVRDCAFYLISRVYPMSSDDVSCVGGGEPDFN